MSLRPFAVAAAVAALSLSGVARAATLVVPDGFPTIQAAVNAAAPGDTVLVQPGTYHEAVSISYKTITLESAGGPEVTIIDGAKAFRPLTVEGANYYPTVRGFTLQNGVSWAGGGVYVGSQADPTFHDLVVRNNQASYGGGMYLGYGTCYVQIIDSKIVDNVATYQGGGTYSNVSCTSLQRSLVARNQAGFQGGGVASIGFCTGAGAQNSLVVDNVAGGEGGGMYVSGSSRCTASVSGNNAVIARNRSLSGVGGGVAQRTYGTGHFNGVTIADNVGGGYFAEAGTYHSLTNTIIWGNGAAPVLSQASQWGTNTVTGVDMEGGVQTGFVGDGTNLSADPLFVDAAAGDYSLSPGSPCIDAGVPTGLATDLLGNPRPNGLGIDIGAYEYSLQRISATAVLNPETITRCATNGTVTAYLSLPAGYDPAAVLVPSVFVDDAFAAERGVVVDGVLVLKFPRAAFVEYFKDLADGPQAVTLTGELPGLARFTAPATVRVKTSACQ